LIFGVLVIVLSVLLRYTDSDCPFGIFKLFFQLYFSYIMATSFSGGRSRSTRREPPTMGKELVNFITCGCESSAPSFAIHTAGREPTPFWW